MTEFAARIDVRSVPPPQRHALIFSTFRGLAEGQALELVNDHDPVPLRRQFQVQAPGQYAWEDLQRGPDLWRAAITRRAAEAAPPAGTSCCGACGGAA